MHRSLRIGVVGTGSLQVGSSLSQSALEALLSLDGRNLLKPWTFLSTEYNTTIIGYLSKVRQGDLAKNRKPRTR